MECDEVRLLLSASADGELDAAHDAQVQRHVEGCALCQAERERLAALRAAVRAQAPYHRAPAALRAAVLQPLHAGRPAVAGPSPARIPRRPAGMPRWAALAATLVIGVAIGVGAGHRMGVPGADDLARAGILTAHIRALQPGHTIDVVSTDQHTVKPWFDGKVDFSPPVKDLGEQGFALAGGRLDYVGNRPVAVIVYRRRQHVIDLFVWPEAGPDRPAVTAATADGYNIRSWRQGGFSLWAASDLNGSELDEFVQRWRQSGS